MNVYAWMGPMKLPIPAGGEPMPAQLLGKSAEMPRLGGVPLFGSVVQVNSGSAVVHAPPVVLLVAGAVVLDLAGDGYSAFNSAQVVS